MVSHTNTPSTVVSYTSASSAMVFGPLYLSSSFFFFLFFLRFS